MTIRTLEFDDAWRDIVSGWLLTDDFDDVTRRIEECAALMERAGIVLDDLNSLQRGTARMMIEKQIARGIRLGHFDDAFNFGL